MARFTDIPNEFTIHSTKKELVLKEDEFAIRQSIRNLVNLEFSDKPFHPEIPLSLKRILFEQLDSITLSTVRRNFITMLNEREPRIEVLEVQFGLYEDDSAIEINIAYKILNTQNTYTISFYFNRIR